MYDFEWHKLHGEKTAASATHILSLIREFYAFESLLDVGCGDGVWLKTSRTLGCNVNKGVDGLWTDVKSIVIPEEDLTIQDLAQEFSMKGRFDVAMSLEVAEHVAPSSADIFVKNLADHSDFILFGAAIPYQGGFRHINEQWQSVWKEKFARQGYTYFDIVRPQVWNKDDVHYWYKQNVLIYVKNTRTDLIEKTNNYIASKQIDAYPLDMVHPEKYEAIASYNQIAFKPLLRNLPLRFWEKSKDIVLRKT